MITNNYKKLFIGILLFIVLLNILFFYISPEEIVSRVGTENGYIFLFLLAAIGGINSLTGTAFIASVVTLGAGGLNPLYLGIIGGLGLFISDALFYFLAACGRKVVPESWKGKLNRFSEFTHRLPTWLVLLGTFIYTGFTPLPNDLLMIVLAFSGYSFKQIAPAILLGAISFSTFLAYLGNFFWF